MKPYKVSASKDVEYENVYGMKMTESVDGIEINCSTSDKAKEVARELYDTGKYNEIYISVSKKDMASCFINPFVGAAPSGQNWVDHFEEQK